MDEREMAAWAAIAAAGDDGPWPDGIGEVELEHVRDTDAELAAASTHPIRRATGRRRVFFADGTSTPWRTAEEWGAS